MGQKNYRSCFIGFVSFLHKFLHSVEVVFVFMGSLSKVVGRTMKIRASYIALGVKQSLLCYGFALT